MVSDKILKQIMVKYAIAGISTLAGYALIWYSAGFLLALGVFLIHMSINFERNADTIKAALKL